MDFLIKDSSLLSETEAVVSSANSIGCNKLDTFGKSFTYTGNRMRSNMQP